MKKNEASTLLWVVFWLTILTAGDPDLLDRIGELLKALSYYFWPGASYK